MEPAATLTTAQGVEAAFQLVFGRAPESPATVAAHQVLSPAELLTTLLRSGEFVSLTTKVDEAPSELERRLSRPVSPGVRQWLLEDVGLPPAARIRLGGASTDIELLRMFLETPAGRGLFAGEDDAFAAWAALAAPAAGAQAPDWSREALVFDPVHYRGEAPEAEGLPGGPLRHFMTLGWRRGLSPNRGFDTRFYLAANDDVREAGLNPLSHFLHDGAREGRAPRPSDAASDVIVLPTGATDDAAAAPDLALAVHLHCETLAPIETFLRALTAIPGGFTLFLTSDRAAVLEHARRLAAAQLPQAAVEPRQVAPGVEALAAMLVGCGPDLSAHDVILHLHTRAPDYARHCATAWRRRTLEGLLFNAPYVRALLRRFAEDDGLGVALPEPPPELSLLMSRGPDRDAVANVFAQAGLPPPSDASPTFCGDSFWARTRLCVSLTTASLDERVNCTSFDLQQAVATAVQPAAVAVFKPASD